MLTTKEQLRLKRYEKDMAMPAWKYILIYGLTFGIVLFIFLSLSDYIFEGITFHWNIRLLVKAILIISIGGFLYGWLIRIFVKRDYKKLKSKAG